jgi:F0F1-type ATP synthase epsilon subunit
VATTHVELVAPDGELYAGQAEMVVCRTSEGDIAFLANHMAYVGLLEPCTVRIVGPEVAPGTSQGPVPPQTVPPQTGPLQGGTGEGSRRELRFEVEGGLVEVHNNKVVMTCRSAGRV